MANLRVFSAYDGKLKVFMTPFMFLHLGQAHRAWTDLANDPSNVVGKHPSDFVLYEVGTFDDDKGVLTPHSPIQQVATATEVRAKVEPELVSSERRR